MSSISVHIHCSMWQVLDSDRYPTLLLFVNWESLQRGLEVQVLCVLGASLFTAQCTCCVGVEVVACPLNVSRVCMQLCSLHHMGLVGVKGV